MKKNSSMINRLFDTSSLAKAMKDLGAIFFIGGMFIPFPYITPTGAVIWGIGKLIEIFGGK